MSSSIKIRTSTAHQVTTVRALIQHPMETGSRLDPDSGRTLPKHHIDKLECALNNIPLMSARWSTGISKNPYLSFQFAGGKPGDKLTLRWEDNLGDTDSLTVTLS